jgi:hypothetical protein
VKYDELLLSLGFNFNLRRYITVFSYSLPFPVVLRIWDIFMLEVGR